MYQLSFLVFLLTLWITISVFFEEFYSFDKDNVVVCIAKNLANT